MARVVTYGRQPTEIPPGNFVEVHFPQLARLDEGTNEGWISRVLSSDGADTRSLPRTISFQELDTFGHDMAAAAGSIWELTVDGETGILSGKGYFADNEWGHKAALAVQSKSLFHNSVDLAEVTKTKVEEVGNEWDDDYKVTVTFEEWKFGKTTLVAMPAFADAYAELSGDAIKASIMTDGPLIVDCPAIFSGGTSLEIVAGMDVRPKWDYFNVPEPDHLTAVTVGEPDENGWVPVHGHFADWKALHRNASGQLVHPPRASDGYAHFCASKVLTDQGMVRAGPVTLLGGHVSIQEAAEKIENTWADVRAVDGKFGPWMSGVVRPHVSADVAKTYMARASQVSGFWPDGKTLRLICSVTAAGFPVLEPAEDGQFALAASLSVPVSNIPDAMKSFSTMSDIDRETVRSWIAEAMSAGGELSFTEETITETITEIIVEAEHEEELHQAAIEERARLLAEGGLDLLLIDD